MPDPSLTPPGIASVAVVIAEQVSNLHARLVSALRREDDCGIFMTARRAWPVTTALGSDDSSDQSEAALRRASSRTSSMLSVMPCIRTDPALAVRDLVDPPSPGSQLLQTTGAGPPPAA
jgi:hypothetical protein